MRGPKPPRIELTDSERRALTDLIRRHSTPQQIAKRARIVLLASEGKNNAQVARELSVSIDMVRLWRERWLVLGAASLDDLPAIDRLSDAPHPGGPSRITDEQVCKIVELACEAPERSGRRSASGQGARSRTRSNAWASSSRFLVGTPRGC